MATAGMEKAPAADDTLRDTPFATALGTAPNSFGSELALAWPALERGGPGSGAPFAWQPSVLGRIRRDWREFVAAEPGARFEARYRRTQQTQRSRAKRIAWLSVGVLLVAVGLFFLVAPGPGILFLIPGAALISQEWIGLARTLDRGEIWLRRRLRRRSDRAAGARGRGKPRP